MACHPRERGAPGACIRRRGSSLNSGMPLPTATTPCIQGPRACVPQQARAGQGSPGWPFLFVFLLTGRWPPTTTQGVTLRSTASRSALMKACCSLPGSNRCSAGRYRSRYRLRYRLRYSMVRFRGGYAVAVAAHSLDTRCLAVREHSKRYGAMHQAGSRHVIKWHETGSGHVIGWHETEKELSSGDGGSAQHRSDGPLWTGCVPLYRHLVPPPHLCCTAGSGWAQSRS